MKQRVLVIISSIFIIFLLGSFTKNQYQNQRNRPIGIWIYKGYEKRQTRYVKRNSFFNNTPGIQFFEDGTLRKKQNEIGCGTKPITYAMFKGKWEILSDSTIRIKYGFYGGIAQEDWLIVRTKNREMFIESL